MKIERDIKKHNEEVKLVWDSFKNNKPVPRTCYARYLHSVLYANTRGESEKYMVRGIY